MKVEKNIVGKNFETMSMMDITKKRQMIQLNRKAAVKTPHGVRERCYNLFAEKHARRPSI